MTKIIDDLNWRYATKKFDPSKKLTDAQLRDLLEALRLTPTSFGLQAYKFIVITDPALREKMKTVSWNQTQVTDASHLIAICAKKTLTEADVDAYIADIATTRGMPTEALKGYRDMMIGYAKAKAPQEIEIWSQKQTYIALGTLLSACAEMKIDSCPMEGFDREKIDALLGLTGSDYSVATLCPVGFRASDDATANMKEVRFPMEKLVEYK